MWPIGLKIIEVLYPLRRRLECLLSQPLRPDLGPAVAEPPLLLGAVTFHIGPSRASCAPEFYDENIMIHVDESRLAV